MDRSGLNPLVLWIVDRGCVCCHTVAHHTTAWQQLLDQRWHACKRDVQDEGWVADSDVQCSAVLRHMAQASAAAVA